jgi:hypothetical protein
MGGPPGTQSAGSAIEAYAKAHGTAAKGIATTAGTLYAVAAG